MTEKQISIPVKVTGAEQARQELQAVGQAARGAADAAAQAGGSQPVGEQATQAATRQAAAIGNVADQTTRAANETINFNRKAQGLVTTVLGAVNPALGQAAGFVLNVVEGVGRLTAKFLAFAGAAAAIGAIVSVLDALAKRAREAADAIERAARAQREQREQGAMTRERLERAGLAAGAGAGAGGQIQREALAIQAGGIPADLAEATATAAAVARATGMPFDPEQFLSGVIARGGRVPDLNGQRASRAEIGALMRAGNDPRARAMLAAFRGQTRDAALLSAPATASLDGAQLDVAVAQVLRERPDLTDDEREAVRKLAARSDRGLERLRRLAAARNDQGRTLADDMRGAARGAASLADLASLGTRAEALAREVPSAQPVVMLNVNTGYFDRGAPPMVAAPEALMEERVGY